jgi:hypothetical protein
MLFVSLVLLPLFHTRLLSHHMVLITLSHSNHIYDEGEGYYASPVVKIQIIMRYVWNGATNIQ